MHKSSWNFFIVVELLLMIWALYQMLSNLPIFFLAIFALFNVAYVIKKQYRTSFNHFQSIVSLIVLALCSLSIPAVWIMLVVAVLFVGLKGVEVSGISLFENTPWSKKQMIIVKTTASESKAGKRFKRPLIGTQRFGNDTYEWDDINITAFSGDTIIDLGNTLLPKDQNAIIVRKGFGKTRILVPTGIGIMLEHTTMMGEVTFEDSHLRLKNEAVKMYSQEYDVANRKLKILTNTLFGDIEVIRV